MTYCHCHGNANVAKISDRKASGLVQLFIVLVNVVSESGFSRKSTLILPLRSSSIHKTFATSNAAVQTDTDRRMSVAKQGFKMSVID